MFKDRNDAGQILAKELKTKYPEVTNSLILALPRGGVVVGAELSKVLNLPARTVSHILAFALACSWQPLNLPETSAA